MHSFEYFTASIVTTYMGTNVLKRGAQCQRLVSITWKAVTLGLTLGQRHLQRH